MNAQSTSGFGNSLDKKTNYWSISNGKGLPRMFWDWWTQNQDTKFRVTYTQHAHEQHAEDFTGDLKADQWIVNDFYTGDFSDRVFECHYDMTDTSRPRKFIMSLPFYNKQNRHRRLASLFWNYTAVSFAANNPDPNHLEVDECLVKKRRSQSVTPSQRRQVFENGTLERQKNFKKTIDFLARGAAARRVPTLQEQIFFNFL